MKRKTNLKVREAIKETGRPQWEIAKKLGYNESVFSRMLREELSENEQTSLVFGINKIKWEVL